MIDFNCMVAISFTPIPYTIVDRVWYNGATVNSERLLLLPYILWYIYIYRGGY